MIRNKKETFLNETTPNKDLRLLADSQLSYIESNFEFKTYTNKDSDSLRDIHIKDLNIDNLRLYPIYGLDGNITSYLGTTEANSKLDNRWIKDKRNRVKGVCEASFNSEDWKDKEVAFLDKIVNSLANRGKFKQLRHRCKSKLNRGM